jgi:hypothetical protein
MTFGSLSGMNCMSIHFVGVTNFVTEVLQMYNRLQDIVREWTALSTKNIGEYEVMKEW